MRRRDRLRGHWRAALVGLLLAVQVVGVAYARTTDTRYLAWAPYDQISAYEVEVVVGGESLAPGVIVGRYPLGLWVDDGIVRGRENRSIAHVHHLIRRTETAARADAGADAVSVTVRASTNGRPPEVWTWSG